MALLSTKSIIWASKSIKRRGLLRTAQIGLSTIVDFSFDLRYGTDTVRQKKLEDLAVESGNKIHGIHYQASKAAPLFRLLKSFNFPKQGTFVDIGCGKGRALLLAAQYGFRRIVGVEFSAELCVIARQNLTKLKQKLAHTIDVAIVEIDAAKFVIQQDHTVFYLYNPFNAVVLEQVMSNLRDSLAASPRKVWIIYNTPVHPHVVKNAGIFTHSLDFESQGNQFCIFHN